jgi:hypothetical protein
MSIACWWRGMSAAASISWITWVLILSGVG